jgi:hypothetical protein
LFSITVTPNTTMSINSTQQFTAVGRDANGNVVTIAPAWTIVAGGGAISNQGLFTAGTVPGSFNATVSASSGGVIGTASVVVTMGALSTITVAPNPRVLAGGGAQQFFAVGRDAGGNVVVLSPVWSVVGGGGSITVGGLFTAGSAAGTFTNTVRASSGTVDGFATVVVTLTVGALASIEVSPNPASLTVNTSQQYSATGRDIAGNVVAITPVWSVVTGGGTIGGTGLFAAGASAGTFSNTVRASSGSITGFATVFVTAVGTPAPLIALGAAASYGVLAGSALTCVNLGAINADAGAWPGSAITGFPPCTITGARHAADAFAQNAQAALTTAYNQLDAIACGTTLSANLGGQTLQPGVYCSTSSQGLTGEMFFNALGNANATLVIKVSSALTTANAQVTLLNGAQAKNIYWLVGSSATLGTGSAMAGNIIAFTSITLVDGTTLLGRALARNGGVSLGTNNSIILP